MGKKSKKNNRNKNKGPRNSERGQIQHRINQEMRTKGIVRNDPSSWASPQEAYTLAINLVTEELLDNVLSRGVVKDKRRLDEKNSLKRYFTVLVHAMSSSAWLFPIVEAVLIGLAKGPPWIDKRVVTNLCTEPWPILHWVCQWKLLRANSQNCYAAGDELVDMVLKAGASVNEIVANKTNAMFFAVKYANSMAIDALLKAGIDLQQRDVYGRTCLYNALEYPKPKLIERLLAEGLDVHETYQTEIVGEDDKIIRSYRMSSSDRVVMLLENIQEHGKTHLISWSLLGAPTSKDIGETLLLLRQKGAKLTEHSSKTLSFLGHLFRDKDNYNLNLESIRHIDLCKDVASYLVGNIVPERFLPETKEEGTKDYSSDEECPICLRPVKHKPVTLCCGHSFCRKCLLNNGLVQRCPLCRAEIGLDITLPDFSSLPDIGTGHRLIKIEKVMGTDTKSMNDRGPTFLDEDQLISEAKFRGLYNVGDTFRNLQRKLVQDVFDRPATELPFTMNNATQMVKPVMDLGTSVRMTNGSHIFLACGHGLSCIEILINGFPVLARVSNRSLYTVISSSVVNALGLKKIEQLKTRKCIGAHGGKLDKSTFTCLEPIVLTIGNIDVNLRNAIEIVANDDEPRDYDSMFGVQLGQDFIKSSRWCPIDFDLGKDSKRFMRSKDLNDEHALQFTKGPSKNVLRFYSHDGKSAYVPLLHFDPFKGETNLLISFKQKVKFDQCMWCSRAFPEGMLTCSICEKAGKLATYCDERCQLAGYKCHKRFHSDLLDTNASE